MIEHPPQAEPDSRPQRTVRMDMHCHSRASSRPVNKAVGAVLSEMPECYSDPEQIYDQAKRRGMGVVTITDHDAIAGGLSLMERGFQDFVLGEEVSVVFPEDHCKIHVTVWGLTADHHEELETARLRDDVYAFADWLRRHGLAHAFAHPLYIQNGRLQQHHLEKAALLFKGWEVLNGIHLGRHRRVVENFLDALTPAVVQEFSKRHGIAPHWSRVWVKGRTGGSDDHALLNIGRTWTAVEGPANAGAMTPDEFLRAVMAGRTTVGGDGGDASRLAHQMTTVSAQYCARELKPELTARQEYLTAKLARFAGIGMAKPSKASLIFEDVKRRILFKRKKSFPLVGALRGTIDEVLVKYPEIRAKLDPATWGEGGPMAEHDRMAEFIDELCTRLSGAMGSGAIRAFRDRDKLAIVDHLISYVMVQAAQLPYLFSLFHQNKERNFIERFEHEMSAPGSGLSVLERPMRISLFTDTLGDVNGVCRFIQNVAHQANATGRDLQVITCTTFPVPDWPNIFNFPPMYATKMPRYEQLEVVLPPLMKILRHLDAHQPDVIHISTPGPVGLIGFIAARMLRVPVLGVYHTDFPAYVDRLFDDHAFTEICSAYMKFFYRPFTAIFTRSQDYVDSLVKLGASRDRTVALMPGLETDRFNTGYRDDGIWKKIENEPGGAHKGIGRSASKILYVGRVSVEKNLPTLTTIWKDVNRRCLAANAPADLVIVGDGPYRKEMQKELKGLNAYFLGFRHGDELSSIYATSDVFAFPSTTDTLGQVVMESQSSGLPVIVTDQGGPKEVVDHGVTGYVVPAEDAETWAHHISDLAIDHAKRDRMGAAAAAAMQKFDIRHSFEHFWEVHVEAWHAHLKTLGIEKRQGPSAAVEGVGVEVG
jgi:glycosyltransferase involved in cell wall biosynthesis